MLVRIPKGKASKISAKGVFRDLFDLKKFKWPLLSDFRDERLVRALEAWFFCRKQSFSQTKIIFSK